MAGARLFGDACYSTPAAALPAGLGEVRQVGYNFADQFEAVARYKGDAIALIHDDRIFSWRQYEERSARLAAAMMAAGLGHDAKVGLYMQNCNEYMEGMFGAFKARIVPININYRYQLEELAYLVENADLEGFIFHNRYAPLVDALRGRFPQLRLLLAVDDGQAVAPGFATPYETALAAHAPMPPIARSPQDKFIFYTGGTTGMPKGVIYHQETYSTSVMPPLAGLDIPPLRSLDDMPRFLGDVEAADAVPRSMPLCPLMHLTAMGLSALIAFSIGGSMVTTTSGPLDAKRVLDEARRHAVTSLVIVGDTFARALLSELEEAAARGQPIRLPALKNIVSSGAMWSREVKESMLEHLDVVLIDAFGSTEGGLGASVASRTVAADTANFQVHPTVKVFTDDDRLVLPGSDDIGRIAVSGNIPIGYYKDEEKTRKTFREIDGVLYSIAGDYAKITADGRVILLGRGSSCINTAGEKVYPEEVEEALKQHPAVHDAAVLGMPDDRFGQRVAAVVASGRKLDPAELIEFMRARIAGYKLPRQLVVVDDAVRTAAGKMDYGWARGVLESELQTSTDG